MKLRLHNPNNFTVLVFVEEAFPNPHEIMSRQVDARKDITMDVDLEGMTLITLLPIRTTEKNRKLESGGEPVVVPLPQRT